ARADWVGHCSNAWPVQGRSPHLGRQTPHGWRALQCTRYRRTPATVPGRGSVLSGPAQRRISSAIVQPPSPRLQAPRKTAETDLRLELKPRTSASLQGAASRNGCRGARATLGAATAGTFGFGGFFRGAPATGQGSAYLDAACYIAASGEPALPMQCGHQRP